jgi:2'-5' RNA ligase
MHRLFVGIDIPTTLHNDLSLIQGGVQGARWRPVDNFHITLRFIGDTTKEQMNEIDSALSQIDAHPFEISLQRIGQFGNNRPRALWVGVKEEGALSHLAQKVDTAMQRIGFTSEHRKYHPHLTLAYLRHTPVEDVESFVAKHSTYQNAVFSVDHFVLFESHLGKNQSQYVKRAKYPLDPVPWSEEIER